uniref:peptidylprolyl isomerase n=1 Tax=Chenopodium quinoa TaxID=63459 RepID=A0A803KQ86_CHEQI
MVAGELPKTRRLAANSFNLCKLEDSWVPFGGVLAQAKCEVSLELKELAFSLHLTIAASAIKLNKFNDAITSCSLILESNKRNVKALFRRGVALEKLGSLDKAYDDFKLANEIEPNNKEIGIEMIRCYVQGT